MSFFFLVLSVVWDSCIICCLLAVFCLPGGNSSATIHLLIHSSLIDYSWSSCFRKQVLVILVMITCLHQKPNCYHLCCCHMWPWEQLAPWHGLGFHMHSRVALLCCTVTSPTSMGSAHMDDVPPALIQHRKKWYSCCLGKNPAE